MLMTLNNERVFVVGCPHLSPYTFIDAVKGGRRLSSWFDSTQTPQDVARLVSSIIIPLCPELK